MNIVMVSALTEVQSRMINNSTNHFRQKKIAGTLNEFRIKDYREPDKYLGSFDALPLEIQQAMTNAIADEDKWTMRGHEDGSWHVKLTRIFRKLRRKFQNYKFKVPAKIARHLSILFQNGPAHAIYHAYRFLTQVKCALSVRPSLHLIVKNAVTVPRNFAVCYARNIPQLESFRGFWSDQTRHNTYGVITGLDLLPSSKGYWFIESNLNFGMSLERIRLYKYNRDPFVSNLVGFAAHNGYRNLIFVNNMSQHLNDKTAKQMMDEALSKNIKLTIIEDLYLSHSNYERRFEIPSLDNGNTLVARAKFYPTSLDYLFHNKRASTRALAVYNMHCSEPSILIPRTGEYPVLENIDEDTPFPNLVYKLPERDAGGGIIFIKARSKNHARKLVEEAMMKKRQKKFLGSLYAMMEDQKGIFQSYIHSPMLSGRKLYKIRAHLLITPAGLQFLSAHRVISRFRVPETLPFGIVKNQRPFLVNLSSSNNYEIIPHEEEQTLKEAALAIGRGLCWAAEYGFQTRA
jgi:hypothetical protein